MNYDNIISQYDGRVKELSAKYETLRFEDVHANLVPYLPETPASILDVGCGTGRDAAWLARKGYDIVAVEPSPSMLAEAKERHPESKIFWLQDKLPSLKYTIKLGLSFDLILLSAVWMHVAPEDRARVFRKLVSLLRPGGMIAISLRHGPHQLIESVHPVSAIELERLAIQRGLTTVLSTKSLDRLGRPDVQWESVILKLPDDGTGTLPVLRHIVLNDSKSSTYKLALLRTLIRVADSASGLARVNDDESISVPIGIVALYWLRLYKPLIENSVPQMPPNKDQRGLSFVRGAFHELSTISPYELRVGAEFRNKAARDLTEALKDAVQTIKKMPAYYTTFPNSDEQIFKVSGRMSGTAGGDSLTITSDFLWSFGEMSIPTSIWNAFQRFGSWIEPTIMFEWTELMQQYAESSGQNIGMQQLVEYLRWLDPERDTMLVRSLVLESIAGGTPVPCVWTGKNLNQASFDVDHCFPFSAWACNDLWNLLPTRREVNSAKRDKLVTAKTLTEARERIEQWWNTGYLKSGNQSYRDRFTREAFASLPLINDEVELFDNMFDALQIKRSGLKQHQNLADWSL